MLTCLRILKSKEKQKNRGKIRSFVGVFEPADHPNGFHREYSGHLSVEFIRRRVHIAQTTCVCIFRESSGALLMERIVLLCTGDERITVPCPPFRATPGQYRAVVNQASFLDEPHSNSRRFMLAERAFRFTTRYSCDTSLDVILETR